MLSFYPEASTTVTVNQVTIIVDGKGIGSYLLVPYSLNTYLIHLNPLDKEHRRYAPQISREALKFGFNEIPNLMKLIAFIPISNRLAIRLAKLSGMVLEGRLTKSFLNDGILEDQEIYGICKEDVCHQ